MCKIKTFIVKPLSSKKENISLIISFILILLVSGVILKIRYKPKYEQKISKTEISSFKTLNNVELGLYSDLRNSLFDLSMIYEETKKIPQIETLVSEEIPPYSKDSSWKQRGSINWIYLIHEDDIHYLGVSNDVKKIGTFLIDFNKENIRESDIYYTKENFPIEAAKKDLDDYMHLFKKLIPYTGNEERKKFKGE